MENNEDIKGNDTQNNDNSGYTDRVGYGNETKRFWIELTQKEINKIKRNLNMPVRQSKKNRKLDSQAVAEYLRRTLNKSIQNTDEKIDEIKETFVSRLVSSFSVSLLDEAGRTGLASMMLKKACRERDTYKKELAVLKGAN